MSSTMRKRRNEDKVSKGENKETGTGSHKCTRGTKQKTDATKPATTASTMTPGQIVKRTVLRVGFILGIFLVMQYYQKKQSEDFAKQSDVLNRKSFSVKCSSDYGTSNFLACSPKQCGRVVMDNIISKAEAENLLRIAKGGMSLGSSSGGATILDLHSGALSMKDKFVNIYKMQKGRDLFTTDDFKLYVKVKNRIQQAIMKEFGVALNSVYLTKPTFFSRMTSKPAKTVHDEYWHPHVDKETYGTFYYTSLLYLADYGHDFTGGRFVFVDSDKNRTVEPRFGRVSFFTSGSENMHYVEKVESGTRYALTVSFTCDKSSAISDPQLPQ